jgi:hypothetical protein
MRRLEAGRIAGSGCTERNDGRVVASESDAIVRLEMGGIVLFYRERQPPTETRTATSSHVF